MEEKLRRHPEELSTGSVSIETPDGEFVAVYSDCGLIALHFPGSSTSTCPPLPVKFAQWHVGTAAAVRAVLEGTDPLELPPLDLRGHSQFRQAVWTEMRKLRCGQTLSYSELAGRLGKPGAARAIGNACGANPIPLLIPCHRILGAGATLGGFSGGLDWKRKLLLRERIALGERSEQTRLKF